MHDDAIDKLDKLLKEASGKMTTEEARYLVDGYYAVQHYRIQAEGQLRSVGQKVDDQPTPVLTWLQDNMQRLEGRIAKALECYADAQPVGRWAMSVCGIGPIISAGLLAHIDITECPTVGHIWSFAGLNPTRTWLGKAGAENWVDNHEGNAEALLAEAAEFTHRRPDSLKRFATHDKDGEERKLTRATLAAALARRPWNARLKTLCWKIGESFVKVSGNEKDVYGHIYLERKAYEQKKNDAGEYAEQAKAILEKKCYRRDTGAKTAYRQGKLPPGHIHARAKRYAVKQFLSDWHAIAYQAHYGKPPPLPYPISHLGHAHLRPVPTTTTEREGTRAEE